MDAVPPSASLRPPPMSASMRPMPSQCDLCRKAAPGSSAAGAFRSPEDVLVKDEGDGGRMHLVVRAEPGSGRSERVVFGVHIALAVVIFAGVAVKPALAVPILLVGFVVLLSGMWLSRIVGARSEFVIDGGSFTAKGWHGGQVRCSPRDVRGVRIEAKGPSAEKGIARTAFDLAVSLDDNTTHLLKTDFRRYEYAEETVRRLQAGLDRAAGRG